LWSVRRQTVQLGSKTSQLVYESLIKLAWTEFLELLEINHSQHHQNLDETLRLVNDVRENNETSQRVLIFFTMYMNV
jgi:hypothetical protein